MRSKAMSVDLAQRAAGRTGAALLIVMGLLLLAGGLATWLVASSNSHLARSRAIVRMEQAAYIAEGGAERAITHLLSDGTAPQTLRGNLGAGRYVTLVLPESLDVGAIGSLSGRININPGNNTNFAFYAERPDGSRISHRELLLGAPDYNGPAVLVGVQPQPESTAVQNQLLVRGALYAITNGYTYGFRSTNMNVRIWNDARAADGRPTGLWWIEFNSANASTTSVADPRPLRRSVSFTIYSTGHVQNHVRPVTIRGVTNLRWSYYALWVSEPELPFYHYTFFQPGDQFWGPVYSRPAMFFRDYQLLEKGQTLFGDRVLTCATNYVVASAAVRPNFQRGITFGAPTQTLSSFDLALLRNQADLVFTGKTYLVLASNLMYVTNARRMWTNRAVTITNENLIYVATADSGDVNTRPGNLYISAVTGMAGRVTFVADTDIFITNHVRLARNPLTRSDSTDVLGLIAGRDALIARNPPTNLEIFAHIVCPSGAFRLENNDFTTFGDLGTLTVYGSLVIQTGFIMRVENSGYLRNHISDFRLKNRDPPRFPAVPDMFTWLDWDG